MSCSVRVAARESFAGTCRRLFSMAVASEFKCVSLGTWKMSMGRVLCFDVVTAVPAVKRMPSRRPSDWRLEAW